MCSPMPLIMDANHVVTDELEQLLETLGVVWVRLREEFGIATVEVAMRNVFEETALEGPEATSRSVQ